MPIYVTRTADGPDGEPRTLADRDTLAQLTGYSAYMIRTSFKPELIDEHTRRALYCHDTVVNGFIDRGCTPRPWLQTPRAKRIGPAKRRRKP